MRTYCQIEKNQGNTGKIGGFSVEILSKWAL